MIKSIVFHLVANAGALYLVNQVLSTHFVIMGGWKGYLIAALIFGLLNSLVKPLLKILSFPFVILTAGLFTLVINMALVWLAKYLMGVLDFEGVSLLIQGGWTTYLYASLLLAVANMIIHWLNKN